MKTVPAFMACLVALSCGVVNAAEPQPKRGEDPQLLGVWEIQSANDRDEKPIESMIGQVYIFGPKNELTIYGHDFQSRFVYEVDAQASPPTLVDYFSNPKFAGSGIYRLEKDKLTWRQSEEAQPLSFDKKPADNWHEVVCRRLVGQAAEQAVEKLKDERLTNKARANEEE
jgi:hypothetical protein